MLGKFGHQRGRDQEVRRLRVGRHATALRHERRRRYDYREEMVGATNR
jgi:hypothetical protein